MSGLPEKARKTIGDFGPWHFFACDALISSRFLFHAHGLPVELCYFSLNLCPSCGHVHNAILPEAANFSQIRIKFNFLSCDPVFSHDRSFKTASLPPSLQSSQRKLPFFRTRRRPTHSVIVMQTRMEYIITQSAKLAAQTGIGWKTRKGGRKGNKVYVGMVAKYRIT
jgi:hypothetical protein